MVLWSVWKSEVLKIMELGVDLSLGVVVVDPRCISDYSCYRGLQEPVGSNISVMNWFKNLKISLLN